MDDLRYPIGRFEMPKQLDFGLIPEAIDGIRDYPGQVSQESRTLNKEELSYRYRPDGWSIYEVIHHTVDSHINAYLRFKKALTEDFPKICGYHENLWTQLDDCQKLPIDNALDLLHPLHERWSILIANMREEDFSRGYNHPEKQRVVTLFEATLHYQWHCAHHLTHVKMAKEKKY